MQLGQPEGRGITRDVMSGRKTREGLVGQRKASAFTMNGKVGREHRTGAEK